MTEHEPYNHAGFPVESDVADFANFPNVMNVGDRAFGTLPNMTYIINQAHTVLFRANWTDPETIRFAVDYQLNVRARRREGLRLNPFYAEMHGFRWVDDDAFFEGLKLSGQKALDEFRAATRKWSRGEHLGTIRNNTLS